MKKALLSLAVVFASASFSQACDDEWWLGKNLGRANPRSGQVKQFTKVSACITAPPLQFQFTASNPNTGRVVVNPVRSAVGRVVGLPQCFGGQCR